MDIKRKAAVAAALALALVSGAFGFSGLTLPSSAGRSGEKAYVLRYTQDEDVTVKLAGALRKHRRVIIPAGCCSVSAPVRIPANACISGEKGACIKTLHKGDVFVAEGRPGEKGAPAKRCENVSVSQLTVIAPAPVTAYALRARSVKNLSVSGVATVGLGVAAVSALNEVNAWDGTPDPVKTGGLLSEEYLSEDIRITGCRADCGREDLGAAAGIVIEYSRRFFVENCSVGRCSQGIEFWGGDSDYSRGGRKENFHAAQKGVIKNCSVADAAGGGIWGSLGQDIRIINCSVSRCLDVGIDFEGCRRALAEGCRAEDCANGNYSTFQYCTEDVVFKNCRSYISGELGATHFFNSNYTQMAADQEIVITGCRFESRGPSRITAFSAMKSFCFLNNICVNAALDTSGNNICSVRAEGNRFIINTPLPESAPAALFAETLCPGRSEIVVKNNDVSGSSEQTGILVSVLSPGGGRAVLENNRVSGCEPPLRVRSSAPVSVEGDYSGAVEKYPPAGG